MVAVWTRKGQQGIFQLTNSIEIFVLKLTFYTDIFQIVVPPLPSKALKRQLPFRSDDGIYEESFIEERRSGLEGFVNK